MVAYMLNNVQTPVAFKVLFILVFQTWYMITYVSWNQFCTQRLIIVCSRK